MGFGGARVDFWELGGIIAFFGVWRVMIDGNDGVFLMCIVSRKYLLEISLPVITFDF